MHKIKEIKATNNYILVTLEDKRKFKISEDDYFEYKYQANQSLLDKDLDTLERISNFHNAYLRALNRIKYKDRSEYEIRNTVYQEYNLTKPEADKIINKLVRYDFINDERYTKELIERSQNKYHGYNKIKDSLIKVRISSKIIEEILIYDEDIEFDIAYDFANKTLKTIRNHNHQRTKQKLRSRLLYRGFRNDLITRVIDEIKVPYNKEQEKALLSKDFDKAVLRYSKKYTDFELRNRIFNYLASRNFEFEMINELLDEMESNNE